MDSKKYISPLVDVFYFASKDLVTASTGNGGNNGDVDIPTTDEGDF